MMMTVMIRLILLSTER